MLPDCFAAEKPNAYYMKITRKKCNYWRLKWIVSNEKDIYLRLDIVNYNGKYCELDSDCNVESFIAWLPVR